MSSKRIHLVTMALGLSLVASLALAGEAKPAPKAKSTKAEATKKAVPAPEAAKAPESAPRMTVVEPVKDFGTIPKGDKLDWSFEIKNTGTSDLHILAAKPGCGCTVTDFDKLIKAGGSGKVNAHVDTTNFAGPIAKSVTVETDDPSNPTAQLTVHAIVKPYVEAFPAGFVRFNLLQGETDKQSVTLYSEEDEPFQIVKVETPGEWVKAEYTKVEDPAQRAQNVGKAEQAQYKFDITVGGADAKLGPIAEKVHIITNSKHQPDYYVSVSGIVRPTYRVEPTAVNFGEVTAVDTAANRSVILHSNDLKTPETFVVSKAVSTIPGVTTSVKPGASKGDFEVTIQVSKDAKPGDVDGNVTIYTSDKVRPTVTIPVKGTIKAAAAAATASSTK